MKLNALTSTLREDEGYLVADARKLTEVLASKPQIDITISSPPYWALKDYGRKGQVGFGQSYAAYLDDIQKIFSQVFRHTSDTGTLWLITDTIKENGEVRPLPFDISERLRRVGWILQDVIIWQKDRTRPWSHQGKLRNCFEYITMFSKGRDFTFNLSGVRDVSSLKNYWVRYPERYSPEGVAPAKIWEYSIPQQGAWGNKTKYVSHACPFPPGLIEKILLLSSRPGDFVFDPFAGSGTVLATAAAMNRRFLGLDLNSSYKKQFESRVLPAVKKLFNSGNALLAGQKKAKFELLNRQLRALKMAKEIVRVYNQQFPRLRCRGILVDVSSDSAVGYKFFLAAKRVPEIFYDRINSVLSRPPLSKYGIKAQISGIGSPASSSALRNVGPASSSMYKYTGGRFFNYSSVLTTSNFLKEIFSSVPVKEESPSIYSRIKIRINPSAPERALDEETA